jgi:hypothetical protein
LLPLSTQEATSRNGDLTRCVAATVLYRSHVSTPLRWIKRDILAHMARKRVLDVISLFLQPCEMMIMNSGVPVLAVQRHWHSNSLPKVHCPLHYNSRGFTSCVTVYSCPHYTTNERTSISAPFFLCSFSAASFFFKGISRFN